MKRSAAGRVRLAWAYAKNLRRAHPRAETRLHLDEVIVSLFAVTMNRKVSLTQYAHSVPKTLTMDSGLIIE